MERPTRLGLTGKGIVLVLVVLAVAYPLLGVIGTSFASQTDIIKSTGLVLWPDHPTLDAYRTIFTGGVVSRALLVSVGITVLGTAASLLATIGMAYGLSRRSVTGSRFILMTALFTMLFNAGIIPNFLLVNQLGLYNTYAALVIPTLMSAFNLVVLRAFFMNLPEELYDAARVDGAGDFRILLQVVLPSPRRSSRSSASSTPSRTGTPSSTRCCTSRTRTNGRCPWCCAPSCCRARA